MRYVSQRVNELHIDQNRKSRRLTDGKRFDYIAEHLQGVVKKAQIMILFLREDGLLPPEEKELLENHFELIEIISLLHDSLEDVFAENTKAGEHINGESMRLLQLKAILLPSGIDSRLIKIITDSVSCLTRDDELPNEEQELDMYQRLRDQPFFFVRLIKLADQLHNAETFSGKEFAKAVSKYLIARQSWEIMFTPEERAALVKINIIEEEDLLISLTQDLTTLQALLAGEISPLSRFYMDTMEHYEADMPEMRRRMLPGFVASRDEETLQGWVIPDILGMCQMGQSQKRIVPNIFSMEKPKVIFHNVAGSQILEAYNPDFFSLDYFHQFIGYGWKIISDLIEITQKGEDDTDRPGVHYNDDLRSGFRWLLRITGIQTIERFRCEITSSDKYYAMLEKALKEFQKREKDPEVLQVIESFFEELPIRKIMSEASAE